MDTGQYDLKCITKTGVLFRKLWFKDEEEDKTLRTLRSYAYYSPISIYYPECFHGSYLINDENNSKAKTKRKVLLDDNCIFVYICDFCEFFSLDNDIMLKHCQKTEHMSFSQYKSCKGVNGIERVVMFKSLYYVNLAEDYNKLSYFMCPFCRILFDSKFSCSYHINMSHKNGYYYSRCSILSKTVLQLYKRVCLECRTKKFLTYLDYVAHLSSRNYRCCPIMRHCKDPFDGFIYIVCKMCSSYAFEHSSNFPHFSDLFEFLSDHPCFTGYYCKATNEVICMKLSVPDANRIKMKRLHDFENANDRDVVIFRLKLCEKIFHSIQLYYRHEQKMIFDTIDRSEFLSSLLTSSMQ